MPRTQKAKGLVALRHHGTEFGFRVPAFSVHDSPDDIGEEYGERFGRPCPIVPRHGFVESRKVGSREEAVALLQEAKAADPDAELILMPLIQAEVSAIWTRGQLILGPGNDGATSGKGAVTIPVTGELATAELLAAAGVTDCPYMEFVYGREGTPGGSYENAPMAHLVQLRNGPTLPGNTKDYIPTPTEVKQVIVLPENESERPDLLAWEKIVQNLDAGTAVYHPGGALASHYAVHCIQRWVLDGVSIPVLTTRQPDIGEVLEPTTSNHRSPDVKELQRGFHDALDMQIENKPQSYRMCGMVMLAGVHNAGVWMGENDFLLGTGMGMAFRLTHMAAMGELRHKFMGFVASVSKPLDRHSVYSKFFNITHGNSVMLAQAVKLFYSEKWHGNFGGPKWAEFSWMGVRLWNAVARGDYTKALNSYNLIVNMAHNCGWAFNKFMENKEMDRSAMCGAYPAIQSMPLLYRLITESSPIPVLKMDMLPEAVKVSQMVTKEPVTAQVTIDGGEVMLQIGWSVGERTKRHVIKVDDAAKIAINIAFEEGAGKCIVTSMSGSETKYVKLEDMGNGLWGIGSVPVAAIEPQSHEMIEEMVWPPEWANLEGGDGWKKASTKKPVVKKAKSKAATPTQFQKSEFGEAFNQAAKTTGGIKIGDWVKCTDPTHPAEVPKVFEVKQVFEQEYGKVVLVYSETKGSSKIGPKHGSTLSHGCNVDKVVKLPGPPTEYPYTDASLPKKKSKTIQVGDKVKCTDPSHKWVNPFYVEKVVKIKGYKYAYGPGVWLVKTLNPHTDGHAACSFKNLVKVD